MQEKTKQKTAKFRTLRSLNIMLWLIFSLFAVAIVLTLALVFHSLTARMFLERADAGLKDAEEEISASLAEGDAASVDAIAYR